MTTTVDETINISGETCLAFPSSWFTDPFFGRHKPSQTHRTPPHSWHKTGFKNKSKCLLNSLRAFCRRGRVLGACSVAPLNHEYPSEMGTQWLRLGDALWLGGPQPMSILSNDTMSVGVHSEIGKNCRQITSNYMDYIANVPSVSQPKRPISRQLAAAYQPQSLRDHGDVGVETAAIRPMTEAPRYQKQKWRWCPLSIFKDLKIARTNQEWSMKLLEKISDIVQELTTAAVAVIL